MPTPLLSGEVKLFDALQSSTYCTTTDGGYCATADRAIGTSDGSYTAWSTGVHWWRASMANTLVHQIYMRYGTKYVGDKFTVSLYIGERQVWTESWENPKGQVFNYKEWTVPGIAADKLEVNVTSEGRKRLAMKDVKVIGTVNGTMGRFEIEFEKFEKIVGAQK